jgi:hypothetical protein
MGDETGYRFHRRYEASDEESEQKIYEEERRTRYLILAGALPSCILVPVPPSQDQIRLCHSIIKIHPFSLLCPPKAQGQEKKH